MSSDSNYTSFIKSHLYRNDLINLWPASVLTTVLMIATRCLTCKQATDSIQWSVYLTVAAAFGVSVATESSGVAKAIADLFVSICECSLDKIGLHDHTSQFKLINVRKKFMLGY